LPEPEPGGHGHEGPVAVRQRHGDRGDALGRPRQDLAPVGGWRLDRPGTARVADDGAVVNGGLQDGAQVGEHDAYVARRELLLQATRPGLDDARAQRRQRVGAELRDDVKPQPQRDRFPGRLVERLGGAPRLGVVAERHLAGGRVEVDPAGQVRLDHGQRPLSVGAPVVEDRPPIAGLDDGPPPTEGVA
jgi:hypothetical protein